MSKWNVLQASNSQELYNNYVKNHPECKLMTSDAIWTQMKQEGIITENQYNSSSKISVFNTNSSLMDSPLVSLNSSTTPIEQPPIPYAPLKYHSDAKDIVVNPQGKVDKNQYSLENLKKQFNEKDYEYKTEIEDDLGHTGYTRTTSTIISKKTQKPELEVITNSESNSYSIMKYGNQTKTTYLINNAGYLASKIEETDAKNFSVTEYPNNSSMLPKEYWEFKNGETALYIEYHDNGLIKREDKYNDNGKTKYISKYDINGKILEKTEYIDDGRVETKYKNGQLIKAEYLGGAKDKHDFDLAQKTADSVYNSLYYYGKCSDEDLQKYLTDITPDNIDDLERIYKEKTGEHLSDILIETNKNMFSVFRSDNVTTLLNHLEKCWEKHYGYDENYRNDNAGVKNKWHTGDPYSVVQNGDNLIAVNQKTGLTSTINLEEFLQNFDVNEKVKMKSHIQKLPGEVIADLAAEMNCLNGKNSAIERFGKNPLYKILELLKIDTVGYSGFYDHMLDDIVIKSTSRAETIVHELGHALDHGRFSYRTTFDQQFDEIFDKEMEIYKQKGNKIFSFRKRNGAAYCTTNKQEMFAECYTLLMTGKNKSKDCILEHFPETLKVVRQMVLETRQSDNRRL